MSDCRSRDYGLFKDGELEKMKSNKQEILDLEAELLRLNALARDRRKQLVRLQKCPNKTCGCRLVWRQQVEKKLAGQVKKIGQIASRPSKTSKSKVTI
jgi:hypothetical protein